MPSSLCVFERAIGRSFLAILSTMSLMFIIAGCGSSGPEMATVTGKVTFRNEPVTQGTISFLPTGPTGNPASGSIAKDGGYVLTTREPFDGALLGDYIVTVVSTTEETYNNDLPGAPVQLPKSTLPKIYEDPKTTTFKATVKSGSNTHNFNLE